MTAVLRNYQVFGAQYVLSRRGAILGDEMGLGKTIEAIAVIAHLSRASRLRCLIVAPASVVLNWLEEISTHSRLSAVKLHGADRADEVSRWITDGGIAVTTFSTLRRLQLPPDLRLDLLIVDEAHQIKNPQAQRSQQVGALAARAGRVLLMTGTPMENHVREFRNLVRYIDGPLADRLLPHDNAFVDQITFREKVAAVYLRRNQEDVLDDLPKIIRNDDLVALEAPEARVYAEAVAGRCFDDMRRAAYDGGPDSAKIVRLREIVVESAENGWKVLVFSRYLRTIGAIESALAKTPHVVVTGADTGSRRAAQKLAWFTGHGGHAVLIGQIDAVGQGLNLQAASVVILAEPQLKPSTEDQAIARAQRMGQTVRSVFTGSSPKTPLTNASKRFWSRKRRAFDAYARDSAAKRLDARAVDPTYLGLEIGLAEQERIINTEARRLGT